jgi:hypothetical protein
MIHQVYSTVGLLFWWHFRICQLPRFCWFCELGLRFSCLIPDLRSFQQKANCRWSNLRLFELCRLQTEMAMACEFFLCRCLSSQLPLMEIAEWTIEGWKLTMDMCVEKSCCFCAVQTYLMCHFSSFFGLNFPLSSSVIV